MKKTELIVSILALCAIGILIIISLAKKTSLPDSAGVEIEVLETRPTPSIENYGMGTSNVTNLFPYRLSCDQISVEIVYPGVEWNNIQVGVTTYSEMVNQLNDKADSISIRWDSEWGNLTIFNLDNQDVQDWWKLETCFVGDTLVAMNIPVATISGFPENINEIISEYGKPDHVTWGWSYFTRTLIWFDKGILMVHEVSEDHLQNVLLFSPLPHQNDSSWIEDILPEEGQEWIPPEDNIDSEPLPPNLDVEDPWGFTKD